MSDGLKPGPNARKRTRPRTAQPGIKKRKSHDTSNPTIRAKRAGVTIGALKKKADEGRSHGDERALVRVGPANTKVLTGEDDLSEWDDEELRRGQRRDKNGRFQGRAPVIVPKRIHDELVRRTIAGAGKLLQENLTVAVEMLIEVVKGQDTEDKDKIKAIGMVMDRVMGKTPEKVEHVGETPKWQIAMQNGIVTVNDPAVVTDEEEDAYGEEPE